jgi:hypothetical protein
MTPEERKNASESLLKSRGIDYNRHLPPIESEEEVVLRSPEEVLRRLVALWAVVGSAFLRENNHFRDYITTNKFESWLSKSELEFLLSDERTERDYVQFTWRLECLYFLSWCAGLIPAIQIPSHQSSAESAMHLFPREMEAPEVLERAISIRPKLEVMNWADLLYRLHWATRNARVTGNTPPPGVDGGVVQEWHRAANWMIRYEGEDDWDQVTTDT